MGTHFWNFQDELVLLASRGGVVDAPYDHGILHRPAAQQRTGYAGGGGQRTPRLLAFDTRFVPEKVTLGAGSCSSTIGSTGSAGRKLGGA